MLTKIFKLLHCGYFDLLLQFDVAIWPCTIIANRISMNLLYLTLLSIVKNDFSKLLAAFNGSQLTVDVIIVPKFKTVSTSSRIFEHREFFLHARVKVLI